MKKSAVDQRIKQAIDKLHAKGGGGADYEDLIKQAARQPRFIQLNLPQLVAVQAVAKNLYMEFGRGTGKTTFHGYRYNQLLQQMPRSTGLFIGPTYQAILTRIIPSLIQGLEMFGLYENLHYFIGQPPPRAWRKYWGTAFQPPKRHNHYITFFNGMGTHLISHDVPGDGRGLNSDWILGDEAALLDARKLQENTDPTLRGTKVDLFKDAPLFGSKLFSSTTPLTPVGQWFIEMEKQARLTPDQVAFIKATCRHNAHNLRDGYLDEARRDCLAEWIYLAEYENVRPNFSVNSFYTLLSEAVHGYADFDYNYYQQVGQTPDCRGDGDLVAGVPLILGADWGAAINCLTVSQYLNALNEHRTLKSMYVLGAERKIQDDLYQDFCVYYRHHTPKECEIWYDNTGNVATGISRRTRAEKAADILRAHGWTVRLMTRGSNNPLHSLKFMLWESMLKENNPALPTFRINRYNARDLILSMQNAKTKKGRNGDIKKDKSSEQSKKIMRQHATDLSDAMDAPIFGRYYNLMRYGGSYLPTSN